MNRLTEQQWAILKAHEDRNYVEAVREDIVRDYPWLADDPRLSGWLNEAYARTKELGFTHDGPTVDFLYLEATTPGFYLLPAIAAWLDKPGASGEQRFEMLLQVTRKKQQEQKEDH
ncbi:hypothetical protein G3N59_21875 [Paraburkholderia sp. Ac-20340]|uniref:hypothetical protein n=1 Tax=Paraburkholderia sp. Ac-20340 TaxID=2703888 RepID=UPI00197E219C|nr:hypothetical protein [Paraburkholderia sp. Ac-20340]MBN3856031.1 hypothetical protein [Paraburkholderia sp. Ac-20340]